jgi:hypothetical protein
VKENKMDMNITVLLMLLGPNPADGTYYVSPFGLVPERVARKNGFQVGIKQAQPDDILPEGCTIGVWTDPDTQVLWLDYCVWVETEDEAIGLCKIMDQLAYWDWANGECKYI